MGAMLGALTLMLTLVGCPQGPGVRGGGDRHTVAPSASDLDGIEHVSLDIRLSGPSVRSYGVAVEHRLSATEQTIATALSGAPVAHSLVASKMTRELARTAPDRLNVPPALVDGLMSWAGLVHPPPRLTVVEMPNDPNACHRRVTAPCRAAVQSLVDEVAATLPSASPLMFGVGVVPLPDGTTRMMVAVVEPAVQLEPIPLSVAARGAFVVRGRLLGGRTKPVVEVVSPTGRHQRVATSVSVDGSFAARLGCSQGNGRYQVEVLADGVHGIEVAANFPVYCGARPPTSVAVTLERVDESVTAQQLARANFLYLNQERKKRGLAPLAWDPPAAAVAYRHSRDMHDNGFVGHVSPRSGDVTARFTRAGLGGRVIRENVARGYGPQGIHASLLSSPGHRANLLATDVTHVGIGVVIGEPETNVAGAPRPVFATQNFYKKPGADVPAGPLGPAMQARVDAVRKQRGLRGVTWDDGLSKVASRRAEALARGRAAPDGYDQASFALGYVSVQLHDVSSVDFDALAELDLWAAPRMEAGVAVARSRARGQTPRYFLVVLIGQRK